MPKVLFAVCLFMSLMLLAAGDRSWCGWFTAALCCLGWWNEEWCNSDCRKHIEKLVLGREMESNDEEKE